MDITYSLPEIDQFADIVRSRIQRKLDYGIILGSGLGDFADSVQEAVSVPYGDIPGWPVSTVLGHQGRLVAGLLENKPVLVLQGRVHYYEGYSMAQVTLSVRVMQRLGIPTLIVTNAAGAINPEFVPGDLMLITDQLNLMTMAGANPLRGPNLDELGPRFPDMSQAYDRELQACARRAAAENGLKLREGVYAGLAGPSFETPADLRYLRAAGADAVGMSTVPEVIVARHGGMRVLGISGISNKANLDGNTVTTHQEVLAAGKTIVPKLSSLIRSVLKSL
ncbi:MAG TPA: purine-nucleoside phosphorylase [Anaerolineaceae bacterium]